MNRLFRTLLRPLPWLMKGYLSRERTFRYRDLSIIVMRGVFHPGLFHSTGMLLQYVETHDVTGSVLELGGGTGTVSLRAAQKGANVTVTDISSQAVENIKLNSTRNSLPMTVIQSDLFEKIERQTFDWILVNPPYYPSAPVKEEDYAWYCGEGHAYFVRFFSAVSFYLDAATHLIMVLSEVCDLPAIRKIATDAGFSMEKIAEKEVWVDGKNYLFQIKRTA